MPKLRKLRSYRVSTSPYTGKPETAVEVEADEKTLSKGQKKRLERKSRVEVKLGKKPSIFEKKMSTKGKDSVSADMLSELEASLLRQTENNSIGIVIKPAATITSNKLKQQVAVREAARYVSVHSTTVFRRSI